jgi:hypothetical protein
MKVQEVTPVVCPQCQFKYNAPITSIIDVSQNPTLKDAFFRGEINNGTCPQCSFSGPLNIPLLYHDSEKELALALVPSILNLSHADEQKIIGNLTNTLINSLPPEQRKGYLLNPQIFMTIENLVKTVLAADGITEEVLQSQAEKLTLLDKLFQAQNETEFKKLIQEHEVELDYQFFEIVTAIALQALQSGDQARGQSLLAFRQVIAETIEQGREIIAQVDEKVGLQTLNPEKLLESLQKATDEDEFMALVSAGKPLLDYSFFQNLTSQIEAAEIDNKAKAEELRALRSRILNASAQVDEENRKRLVQAGKLLQDLLEAKDPRKIIETKLDQFDDVFLSILVANIQEAERNDQEANLQKLTNLYKLVLEAIQEKMPPEMQFFNQLISANSPEAVRPLLEQNKAQITPEFFALLDHFQAEFEARGQRDLTTLIAAIRKEAKAIKITQ